ncbi:MAG: hypothetical protein OXG35_06110 [Acidobacteria bacterium]|nr:hypothetical protein [Acidobacteriota bacterium]
MTARRLARDLGAMALAGATIWNTLGPGDGRTGEAAAARAQAQPLWWVDFGDDGSQYANDGECDDPRFEGDGTSSWPDVEDRRRDATDCRRLHEAGRVRLWGVDLARGLVDFGTDRSTWANDDECDDPRFEGAGVADTLLVTDRGRDATDCRLLYERSLIRLSGVHARP